MLTTFGFKREGVLSPNSRRAHPPGLTARDLLSPNASASMLSCVGVNEPSTVSSNGAGVAKGNL